MFLKTSKKQNGNDVPGLLAQQDAILQRAAEVLVSKALPSYSLGREEDGNWRQM